ncbi:hypothetical protein F5B22DRAFT_195269 [Xylaria bambusicola]|uniref:uncharacterized protein n=1 Tax=Xylaria bambusicola TaxID=326684 RepID=UPI002007A1BE|nr:uncharacterized protein F5B22DRAFT_195269 [Xylaria bambusicola]KAI0515271.1 hypothetical protein F5B22DRAFT_195269 [Xylaria bambusicola]
MRVAIAGYSDLGRYICEEFLKAGHEVVVLTRSHKPQLESQGITQAITDYTLQSLKAPLANCEVLISTISDFSSVYIDVHKTLILACQESPKCKRFMPAEFAVNIEAYPDQPGFYYAPHEPIREMLRNQTDVEWTLVCLGWLADYFLPTKNRYIKDISGFHPINWEGNKIVIPGTGNEPVDFTWARDVATALASLVAAPKGSWEPYTFMSGERSSWNDATQIIKEKFRPNDPIEHVSLHAVAEMIKTAKDEDTMILADYYLLSISQACGIPADKVHTHREKFFSGVRFRTLQEGLSQFDDNPNSVV